MSNEYINRLVNFEVQPPASAWGHIADELSANGELSNTSTRLFEFDVEPPAGAWEAVQNSLEPQIGKTVKHPASNRRRLFPVLAAAVVLGIIATGILYLMQTGKNNNETAIDYGSAKKSQSNIYQDSAISSAPSITDAITEEETARRAPSSSQKISETYPVYETGKPLQNAIVKKSPLRNELQIMVAAKPIRNARGEIIQNPAIINSPVSHYISITAPNGQQTKISSKFMNMLLFLNADNDVDQVDGYFDKNFLESLIWKSRFRDWRNEIINTSFVPSSANFMDILDFKDLLTKDRQ